MQRTCMFSFSWIIAFALTAQTPPPRASTPTSSSPSLAEMKRLAFLAGQWKGESWIEFGPQRRTAVVTENIQSKQDGLLLLIEGRGRGKAPDRDEEITVHEALGVVFYDVASKRHVFHAYKGGNFIESEFKMAGDSKGFQWGFRDPRSNGDIRFTMSLTDSDRWIEIGEFSQDGKTWHKFFEM